MKYIKFKINKFKSIDSLELDFTKYTEGNIFPLVGLNEAGKTTILEAISFFQKEILAEEMYSLVHKRDRGSFTNNISIEATLKLDQVEKEEVTSSLEEQGIKLNGLDEVSIKKSFKYNSGKYHEIGQELWDFNPALEYKEGSQRKFKDLYDNKTNMWEEIVDKLASKLPKILYFENFIFNFPNKIF